MTICAKCGETRDLQHKLGGKLVCEECWAEWGNEESIQIVSRMKFCCENAAEAMRLNDRAETCTWIGSAIVMAEMFLKNQTMTA